MSRMSVAERFDVLHRLVEPTLQRELRHRGVIADEGSYSAELVAWVELDGSVVEPRAFAPC
jgi:hypothetical protein